MNCFLVRFSIFLLNPLALQAFDTPTPSYNAIVSQRLQEGINFIEAKPWPSPEKSVDWQQFMALLFLSKDEKVDEANRLVLNFCSYYSYGGPNPTITNRSEALFRIYLQNRTRRLLTSEARKAIEDYAWSMLNKDPRRLKPSDADRPFWDFDSTENHYLNDRRRYMQALQIVCMSQRYGPKTLLEGQSVESNYQGWVAFWIRYFRARAGEGTDLEVSNPGSYGQCTAGVYYDLYDLTDSDELRNLTWKFLTLYWAEVAAEFEPRTGQRAVASTRWSDYAGSHTYWARPLLSCYRWHDAAYSDNFLGEVPFLISSYRPPMILSLIAHNPGRGAYLSTSRRAGMLKQRGKEGLGFDEKGNSNIRRDVYYTPDYTLSTMTLDPARDYDKHIILAQLMGANFASDIRARITVSGTGYYAMRALNGITGPGVSIVGRDPNAVFGLERFKSNGTRVFISNGELWNNRIEDKSGWLFTRAGDAYAAIRVADGGYTITTKTYEWPNRKLKEVEETKGHLLEFNDLWSPVVIQMARANDYKSFAAFCDSVKARPFDDADGKLTYVSEGGDTYEYRAKSVQLPQINHVQVNLNPEKTYDSPYLSMNHGSSVCTISYPGQKPLVLDFSASKDHLSQRRYY